LFSSNAHQGTFSEGESVLEVEEDQNLKNNNNRSNKKGHVDYGSDRNYDFI